MWTHIVICSLGLLLIVYIRRYYSISIRRVAFQLLVSAVKAIEHPLKIAMRPPFLLLVRHGQSEGNVDDTIYERVPDHRVGLTPLGKEQAREAGVIIAKYCKGYKAHFLVSPYLRSKQTLEGILESFEEGTYDMTEEPRLREQEWGTYLQSKRRTDKMKKERYQCGSFFYRFAGGESGADVFDRVSAFCGSLHRAWNREYPPRAYIIVSHGLTIRLLMMRWFHQTVQWFERTKNLKNCEIVRLDLVKKGNDAGRRYTIADDTPIRFQEDSCEETDSS